MSLKEKIQEDLQESLKAKEELKTSVLRLLFAAISNKESDKRTKIWKQKPDLSVKELEKESQLTDEEISDVISSEAKKRREAMAGFEAGGRKDSVKKEKAELEILKIYLPEQLSAEDLKKLAKEAIDKTGAKEPKDMGKVMGVLMPQIKGRADGNLVSQIIKELLIPKK